MTTETAPALYVGERCAACGGDHYGDDDAKVCPRCGYLQILEAFPMHLHRGKRVRSSWCRSCWSDHSAITRRGEKP